MTPTPRLLLAAEVAVLRVLARWDGWWHCYDTLCEDVARSYGLDLTLPEARRTMARLRRDGMVEHAPCFDVHEDGRLRGSGNFITTKGIQALKPYGS